MSPIVWSFSSLFIVLSLSSALGLPRSRLLPRDLHAVNPSVPSSGNATFGQFIDHDNPKLGSFSQRYWWSNESWAGPGSPVVIFTPGETAAAGYTEFLTNRTIIGQIAQAIGGAAVVIEHRYFGQSSPYNDLSTENLQQLTVKNVIADFVHFAETVTFPFDPTNSSQASSAPWVLSGGSYAGALAAWTASTTPGTFWAYYATGAPVKAIYDFWEFFVPIQKHMPQNCSKDVSLVIDYVDGILKNGTAEQIKSLKESFGLAGLPHDDDFASVLLNGPELWLTFDFYTGYSPFYQFCDYVENAVENATSISSAGGVGLQKAFDGYATWLRTQFVPGYCASYGDWTSPDDLGCFDTYNAASPYFTNTSVANTVHRQFNWLLCNEPLAWWNDAAPEGRPSLVSRLINAPYWQRQCELLFPPENGYTYGSATGKTTATFNEYTGGWAARNNTRILFSTGEFDAWLPATVSSPLRPGGPLPSSKHVAVEVVPGGFHYSDLYAANADVNEGVKEVMAREVQQIKEWVGEYKKGTQG